MPETPAPAAHQLEQATKLHAEKSFDKARTIATAIAQDQALAVPLRVRAYELIARIEDDFNEVAASQHSKVKVDSAILWRAKANALAAAVELDPSNQALAQRAEQAEREATYADSAADRWNEEEWTEEEQ